MKTFNEFIEEAVKLGTSVIIHKGPKELVGKVGHVGEIRHGLYKGAPKTYTIYHGEHGATQLDRNQFKIHKGLDK